MYKVDYVYSLLGNYEAAVIDNRISPNDAMNNQWYFQAGKSAIENIVLACLTSNIQRVKKVLDIPCGHGRVLRHLIHLFQGAEFHACDLDRDGVDFCASAFGAKPIYSREELTDVEFGSQYDLIWVGSLFTHTSHDVTRRWMSHLVRFLSPYGIVVATVHGRWCEYVHEVLPYIEEDKWQGILKDYFSLGYGYCDYSRQELHSYITGSYGVSLAKPHVIIRDLEDMSGIRIYLYRERGWVDHHDVIVFGRPSYNEAWTGIEPNTQQQEEPRCPDAALVNPKAQQRYAVQRSQDALISYSSFVADDQDKRARLVMQAAEIDWTIGDLQDEVARREQALRQLQAQLAEREQTVQMLQEQVTEKDWEIHELKHSESYRLGLFCTWPFRKVQKIIRHILGKERESSPTSQL